MSPSWGDSSFNMMISLCSLHWYCDIYIYTVYNTVMGQWKEKPDMYLSNGSSENL